MQTYVLKRLLLMIPTLFGTSIVVWAIVTGAPEPPIVQQVPSMQEGIQRGQAGGVPQAVKVFRAQYGLDKPKILNTYYELDQTEVRRTLEDALDAEGTRSIKVHTTAQEQLILWGTYAVPALMQLLRETDGPLRDFTAQWLVKSAQRVALGEESGSISAKRARLNVEITKENENLDSFLWQPDATDERKEAGITAFEAWYRGVRDRYPGGADPAAVRQAVEEDDAATLEGMGATAVPALVDLVLQEGALMNRAIPWLTRLGRMPEDTETNRLQNAALQRLAWAPSDPLATRAAGVALVRDWWEGAVHRWDYSGLGWLHVLFLETQFATYWGNLFHLDLGISLTHKVPVLTLILERLKYSLTLAVSSLLLAYIIAVPLGVLSAKIHGTWPERAMALFVFALYSLPSFYVATLAIRYLAEGQPNSPGWIPTGGFQDLDAWKLPSMEWIKDIAWHVVAPILCMTYASLAGLSRYAKTGVLNVIRSDYVRTARAKGLGEFMVTVKHAARNGILPIVTLLATTLPVIVGGSFIIEYIFNIPGFGLLTLKAILERDYNVIIGVQLVVAVLTMVGILLSDLLYAVVDPRISYS